MAPKRHITHRPPLSRTGFRTRAKPIRSEPQWIEQFLGQGPRPSGAAYWAVFALGEEWDAYVRFDSEEGHPVVAELRVLPRPRSEIEEAWIDEWFKLPENLDPELVSREGGWPEPPDTPKGGLTARKLRKLNLGQAVQTAYRELAWWVDFDKRRAAKGRPPRHSVRDWIGFSPQAVSEPRKPGRRGRGDSFYAEVAAAYVSAYEQGSHQPVVDTAARLSKARGENYSRTSVRDLLSEARRRGLLTQQGRGYPGGELTEKGRRALGDSEEAS